LRSSARPAKLTSKPIATLASGGWCDQKGLIMRPAVAAFTYSGRQKTFHWIVAVLVFGLIPAGLTMNRIGEGTVQDTLYDLHRSFGMVVLALVLVRIANRVIEGAPLPAENLSRFERTASIAVHALLYALLVVMPLLGWAAMSAYGGDWKVFYLFTPPQLLAKSEPLSDVLFRLHEIGGFALAGLLIFHIGAAVVHGLRHDGILARMLPGSPRREP
jgi:cytochrome b561